MSAAAASTVLGALTTHRPAHRSRYLGYSLCTRNGYLYLTTSEDLSSMWTVGPAPSSG